MTTTLFTSESVSEGHPDKVADQISDAVLDAILSQDKRARVACETMVKTGVAIVAGEVTTFGTGKVGDEVIEKLIRKHFDLRPYGILQMLDLVHPIYQRTASYGHFGRKPKEVSYVDGAGKKQKATAFSWEKTDKAAELRKAAKLK